jgi:hypothetical protein
MHAKYQVNNYSKKIYNLLFLLLWMLSNSSNQTIPLFNPKNTSISIFHPNLKYSPLLNHSISNYSINKTHL